MKRFFGFAFLFVLLATPAFAGKKSQTVTFGEPVQVGSTQVPVGSYAVTWTGTGPNVQVTLAMGKKSVVSFAATVVEGKANPGLETYTHNGSVALEVIHLNNVSLTVTGAPQPGQ